MTVQFHEIPCQYTVKIHHSFQVGTGKVFGFNTAWQFNPTTTTPTNPSMANLATAAQTAWTANMSQLQHSSIILIGTRCTDLTNETAAQGVVTSSAAGNVATAPLSLAQAALVNYRIQRHYRGGKGRNYLPVGVAANLADPTHWAPTFITVFTTQWGNYLNAIGTNTFVPFSFQVVRSYFKGSQPNSNPSIWAPRNEPLPRTDTATGLPLPATYQVLGWTLNPVVGSQEARTKP
jgi:hypothetical protein